MTPAFERVGESIVMRLSPEEHQLLSRMRGELHGLLEAPDEGDAVTDRLFPSAVGGDEEADRELRALIHDDLREQRLQALDDLLGVLERAEVHDGEHVVELAEGEPTMVLGVLNDLRLALGARVGLATVELRELVADESAHPLLAMMDWFAMWQEQLLVALDPLSASHYDHPHDPHDPDER